jgi:hypothetical protein
MRHGTTALSLAALFAAVFSPALQHDPPVAPRRVIGLVEVPRLFGESPPDDAPPGATPPATGAALNLFHEPNDRATVAVTVRGREALDLREHGYEELSAVAYGRRNGWFLLRSKGRFAWLSPRDAGEFRPYPQLFKDALVYLTRDWDRTLRNTPGGAIKTRVRTEPDPSTPDPDWDWGNEAMRPSDALVVELREHNGDWWAHVRVGPSPCESDAPAVAEGWVPAFSEAGLPTLWFHSRGC